MSFSQPCPNCRYQRKPTDVAPDWQCPACGVAYTKAMGANQRLGSGRPKVQIKTRFNKRTPLDWFLTLLFFGSLVSLTISFWASKQLPPVDQVIEDMLNEPNQSPTRTQAFDFEYRARYHPGGVYSAMAETSHILRLQSLEDRNSHPTGTNIAGRFPHKSEGL